MTALGERARAVSSPLLAPAIDAVAVEDPGSYTAAISAGGPYLSGHFREFPIFPGVFTIEAVCEAVRALEAPDAGRVVSIRSARFLSPVRPGDVLRVELESTERDAAGIDVRANVDAGDGRRVAVVRARLATRPGADDRAAAHAEVRRLLPHDDAMVLIDRVVRLEADRITAIKAVTASEPCYHSIDRLSGGAEPDYRYPEVLLLESLGQAAALLWQLAHEARAATDVLVFASASDVEFPRPVYPGDVVHHDVRLDRVVEGCAIASGESVVDGHTVARCGFIAAASRSSEVLVSQAAAPRATDGSPSTTRS